MSLPRLSWNAVNARRLERNALAAPVDKSPVEIVDTMCGAHAQVLSAAELSIGLRVAGSTRTGVQDALWERRELVKTFGPRGTVHLLPTSDLPMWTAALAAVPASRALQPGGSRLTPEQTEEIIEAVGKVLADAELTIEEADEAVAAATGPWAADLVMPAFQTMWPRWRQAIHLSAARGALCFGPNRGRKVTYTSPSRWMPGFAPMDTDAALAELVRRYLHAYGPATSQHFARWVNAPRTWAANVFAALGDRIEAVDSEGETAWVNAGDIATTDEPPWGVRLLPYFDAYAIACQPREKLYAGEAYARATARGQAGNFPVLLIDGIVAGVWHLKKSGRRHAITVESLAPLDARQLAGVEAEVTRIAEFSGGTATLTIGPVTVGGHA